MCFSVKAKVNMPFDVHQERVAFFNDLEVTIENFEDSAKSIITHFFDELKNFTQEDLSQLLARVKPLIDAVPTANKRPVVTDFKVSVLFDGAKYPIIRFEFMGYGLDCSSKNHIVFLGNKFEPIEKHYSKLIFECAVIPHEESKPIEVPKNGLQVNLAMYDKGRLIDTVYKNSFNLKVVSHTKKLQEGLLLHFLLNRNFKNGTTSELLSNANIFGNPNVIKDWYFSLDGETYITTAHKTHSPRIFSMCFWFKTDTPNGVLMSFGSTKEPMPNGYDRHVYFNSDGGLTFGCWRPNSQRFAYIHTAQKYADGKWHFVVAKLNHEGMKLFIDGGLIGKDSFSSTEIGTYDGYWRIGRSNMINWEKSTNKFAFKGDMGDIRLYERDISEKEIQILHKYENILKLN